MKIKNSVLDNATLAYDEVGAETEVIVDASPVGLGAMLTQKKRDGYRPFTHIIGSVSPFEQRYSQTEREALAIRWACWRLRVYLAWIMVQGCDRSQAFRSHIQQLKQ